MSRSNAPTLAAAALAYLCAPSNHLLQNIQPPASDMHQIRGDKDAGVTTSSIHAWQVPPRMDHTEETVVNLERNEGNVTQKALTLTSPAPTPPPCPQTTTTLPSLLQYVDNDLLRRRSEYDAPPYEHVLCSACGKHHYMATIKSTYLPLTCGCWIHYRCFIGHVMHQNPCLRRHPKDCCPACGTRLFVWEGIIALTLAERTNVLMPNATFPPHDAYVDVNTGVYVFSDEMQYEADCELISALIQSHFLALFAPGAPESRFADHSPDLTACYYDILSDLDNYSCPRSKWLAFNRGEKQHGGVSVGFLMFGMLVALKMKGFLNVHHAAIVATEGWAEFENAREGLQRRILSDVRGAGWSWSGEGNA